jgi:ABC-type multidrug transport system ATPase subunit
LDEPTTHMSSGQKRMIWEFIARQKKHRTVVAAMQTMNESDFAADRVVYLDRGDVRVNGSLSFLQQKFGKFNIITSAFRQKFFNSSSYMTYNYT